MTITEENRIAAMLDAAEKMLAAYDGEAATPSQRTAYEVLDKALSAALSVMPRTGIVEGWKLVPVEPTPEMWGELARDMIFWDRYGKHNGTELHHHLKSIGHEIPDWLAKEIPETDQVPPKGTVAACIYKAMLSAAPPSTGEG